MGGNLPVGMSRAGGVAYSPIKRKTLLASAARTATATGNAVTSTLGAERYMQKERVSASQFAVWLIVTAAAAGTLDLTIQGSDDDTNWVTMTPREGAWTQVTTTPGRQMRTYNGPVPRFLRAVGTAASSPNHTYEVIIDLQ